MKIDKDLVKLEINELNMIMIKHQKLHSHTVQFIDSDSLLP